jgi:glycine/D-amino acid oxidase-like deaminating enzyme
MVAGGGILGLWTADILSSHGHTVTVISKSSYIHTTSAAAVCVLTPFFPGDPTTESFKARLRWAADTLIHIQQVDLDNQFLERIPCFEFGLGDMLESDFPVTKLKYLDFSTFQRIDLDHLIAGCDFAIGFDCHLCNTSVFLPWLYDSLTARGVQFVSRNLETYDELIGLEADVIFNCLGFPNLVNDPELYPVQGQSMFIPMDSQPFPHFGVGQGHHAVFKHRRGFYIGSYFIENSAGEVPQKDLYLRSTEFVRGPFPDLCRSVGFEPPVINLDNIVRVNNGVRPFRRSGPRVEIEVVRGKTLIHNYGHGAHGWTIGYASAREAVFLAGL